MIKNLDFLKLKMTINNVVLLLVFFLFLNCKEESEYAKVLKKEQESGKIFNDLIFDMKFGQTKDDYFIGKEELLISINSSTKKMINFKMIDRGIPRNGYDICNKEGDKIGNVTSGTFSPTNKVGIGIGYVNIKHSLGDEIYLLIRDKLVKAEITKLPLKNG